MNISALDKLTGKQFETFLERILLPTMGFNDIQSTKKSGDYGADLISWRSKQKFVIQSKRYNRPVGLKAVQEVYAARKHYKTDCCMVASNQSFTHAAQNLALSCQCLLLGRDELQGILKGKFNNYDELIESLRKRKVIKYKISNKELIDAYFNLKKQLVADVRVEDMDVSGLYSSSVYRRRWGSWNGFLKSINEPLIQEKNIKKDILVAEFQRVARFIGKVPTIDEMKKHSTHAVSTFVRTYGGWNKFLVIMGKKVNKKQNISKDEFIVEFRRVKQLLGYTPSTIEMKKHGDIAPNSYKRIWGSWSNFLKEMEEPYQKRNITKEDLVKAYLKLKKQLNKDSLTQRDMDDYGDYSSSVYLRRFGSWNKFLTSIVYDKPNINTNISKGDLKSDYYRIKNLLGKQKLSAMDIKRNGKYSLSTYLKKFGKWNDFLKSIGEI